jgi:hypothetical protein
MVAAAATALPMTTRRKKKSSLSIHLFFEPSDRQAKFRRTAGVDQPRAAL